MATSRYYGVIQCDTGGIKGVNVKMLASNMRTEEERISRDQRVGENRYGIYRVIL